MPGAQNQALHEMPGNFSHFLTCLSESGILRNA